MDIQLGILYVNKTYKYLLPCLKEYGETFVVKHNNTFNLAFGIHDCILDATPYEEQRLIYLLCDKAFQPNKFYNFLDYVKVQSYFCMDYAFDDIELGRKHMIVLKFPEKLYHVYDMFNTSQYSKMYTREELDKYFNKEIQKPARLILERDSSIKAEFLRKLNSSLGTRLTIRDLDNKELGIMELDFPLEEVKEFFNYKVKEN